MAMVNQAIVIGYVGNEPKITATQSNGKIASFSIATKEKGYTKQDGTIIPDKTEWHNIVAWDKLAEFIEKYVHKGAMLYLQGKMRTRSYKDKFDITRYVMEIHVENIQLLDRKNATTDNDTQSDAIAQQPARATLFQPSQNYMDEAPF